MATFQPRLLTGVLVSSLIETPEKLVMIDARPFSEYAVSHISGALNVKLSSLLTRRLASKKVTVEDLVNDDQRVTYTEKIKIQPTVLIYAEHWEEQQDANVVYDCKNPVHVIYCSLAEFMPECYLLQGGFTSFKTSYPALVEACEADPLNKISPIITVPSLMTPLSGGNVTQSPTAKKKVADFAMSEVLPYLYIGSQRDAADLPLLNACRITYVLNLTTDIPNSFESVNGFLYHRIPIKDTWNQNLSSYFDDALEFIRRAKESDGRVLVHCMAGISRSAAFTIAYLIRELKMPLTEAFGFLKMKRAIVAPNLDFMGELQTFEKSCMSSDPIGWIHGGSAPMPILSQSSNTSDSLSNSPASATIDSHPDPCLPPPTPLVSSLNSQRSPHRTLSPLSLPTATSAPTTSVHALDASTVPVNELLHLSVAPSSPVATDVQKTIFT